MACVISIPWRSKLHKALIMVKGVARCLWMLPLAALLFVLNLVYGKYIDDFVLYDAERMACP